MRTIKEGRKTDSRTLKVNTQKWTTSFKQEMTKFKSLIYDLFIFAGTIWIFYIVWLTSCFSARKLHNANPYMECYFMPYSFEMFKFHIYVLVKLIENHSCLNCDVIAMIFWSSLSPPLSPPKYLLLTGAWRNVIISY